MRTINADGLLNLYSGLKEDDRIMVGQVRADINAMPTVDPIKHAHWIAVNPDRNGENASIFQCSNCDGSVPFHFFVKNSDCRKACNYYYCPQCGAKMDGGNK